MPGKIGPDFADDDALFNAVMAGASGYVLKQIHGSDLIGAVRTIAAGQSLLAKLSMQRRTQAAALAARLKADRPK